MMMNNWHAIWQRRSLASGTDSLQGRLLAMDGHDGMGALSLVAWQTYIDQLTARLEIQPSDSLFEVGCGSGAALYPFYQRGLRVGGADYAENMVRIAQQVMPNADIQHLEAAALPPAPTFDIVMSHGVFLYFPDHAYAQAVLERMLAKARKWVCILDVPDLARKAEALKQRKEAYGAAYDEKYQGLEHLYYSQDFFARTLTGHDVTVEISSQNILGYLHNRYRYNVYVRRAGAAELS